MVSGLWQAHTGRPSPGFHGEREGALLLGGDVGSSPGDSVRASACPAALAQPSEASSRPRAGLVPGPGQMAQMTTDVPRSSEHGSAVVTLADSLHQWRRGWRACYVSPVEFWRYMKRFVNLHKLHSVKLLDTRVVVARDLTWIIDSTVTVIQVHNELHSREQVCSVRH